MEDQGNVIVKKSPKGKGKKKEPVSGIVKKGATVKGQNESIVRNSVKTTGKKGIAQPKTSKNK